MTTRLIAYVGPIAGLVIIAALLIGLRASVDRAGFGPEQRQTLFRGGAIALIAWYAIAFTLSYLEFFRGASDRIPTIELGLLTPILVGGWLIWRTDWAVRLIDAAPQPWLIGVQIYRALGFAFLVLLARGALPPQFAWPAGTGDIFVGLAAPLVAMAYARGAPHRDALAFAWNVFGILDLVVAVTMGFLTSPSPVQMLALTAPNELISAFPLVMVPVFAVPVSILLHIVSLIKLDRERRPAVARA